MGNWLKRHRCTGEDIVAVPSRHCPPYRHVIPNHLLPDDLNPHEHPNRYYASNVIKTTKYSVWTFLPRNLFQQFHRAANIYFLFIVCLNWVPQVTTFANELAMIPFLFVLGVSAVKDGLEDYQCYRSDKRVNVRCCRVYSRKEGRYVRTEWKKIKVGDFVHLSCNETIPADILLLQSSDDNRLCYIETANLDGETNLKQRESVKGISYSGYAPYFQSFPNHSMSSEHLHLAAHDGSFHPVKFRCKVQCDLPNTQIYRISGAVIQPTGERISLSKNNILLRECVVRNTDFVEGIVLYAGHDTKALLNNRGSSYKRSKLEKHMNKDVLWSVALLILMCGCCALGSAIWQSSWTGDQLFIPYYNSCRKEAWCEGFLVFWSFVIIFQVLIPLSLYVSVELLKLGQVFFIHNDLDLYDPASDRRIECRAWNITEDLGQIQYVFCDKTGTLTENKMEFKRCSIGGRDFSHEEAVDLVRDGQGLPHGQHDRHRAINSVLCDEVSRMSVHGMATDNQVVDSTQSSLIHDFFLAICLCNTVVVSRPHLDQMDDSGYVHPDGGISVHQLQVFDAQNDQAAVSRKQTRTTSMSKLSEASLQTRYEAESPDELTLVRAACAYGCRLLRRSAHNVCLWLPQEGEVDCRVLHTLHFNSARQCMSVIVRHPSTQQIILYCKGADSKILDNLAPCVDQKSEQILRKTQRHIQLYAESGLRTLCMARRVLSKDVYDKWLQTWLAAEQDVENSEELLNDCALEIETNLELIGASGIEDCLQDGVSQTIASLRQAGMKVWMITGDKQETAVNIAHSCKLVSQSQGNISLVADSSVSAINTMDTHLTMLIQATLPTRSSPPERALIVDGKTLSFILTDQVASDKFAMLTEKCTSVVCCRTTPLQKAAVVGLIKEKLDTVTLAIGDGANDVNMIQTANVGIGISGLEGMQAAMASDFAIARFRFLEKLLLVHGHWCYDRLAAMIAYNFYKSCMFIFLLFWYQLYNGFSGSVMIDQYYLLLYNVCFTTLGPIIQGIFDQDVKASTLLAFPVLYKQGPECKVYTRYTYWVNVADALWQSLAIYFIPHFVYSSNDIGIWQFGSTSVSACVVTALLHNGLEFRAWTIYHVISIFGSWVVFMAFGMIFNAICYSCNKPSDPYWVMETAVTDGKFWFGTLLACVVALLPRYTIIAMMNSLNPTNVVKAKLHDRDSSRGGEILVEEDFGEQSINAGTSYTINGSPAV